MEYKLAKLKVDNKVTQPIMVFVEPWGRDYWLQPGETFVLTALSDKIDPDFYFHIIYSEQQIDVYAEGRCYDVSVILNGQELECGHNRPKGHFT